MNWWENIKNFFKREVRYLGTEELKTIFDHERVDFDSEEFERIDDSFRIYAGKYEDVKYLNSLRKTKERPYMYLNMMNEAAKYMGSILFNEKCEISFAKGSVDETYINHVLQHNDFNKNFSRYIQVMLATGGLAAKPYYDAGSGEIKFSWALADAFIPLHSNSNNISEAVIPSYTQKVVGGKTYFYTLLEFHEWGAEGAYAITNELYRSEKEGTLGKRVDLAELYEGLQEVTTFKAFSRPNFAYLTPFGFNNQSPQSPLGLGIADNAKTTLEQINNAYDQYHWEVKQGKRKVIVSDHFLHTRNDGKGRPVQYLDDDSDVFIGLPGDMDNMTYKDITANIRSSQYIDSINKFISTLEMQTGLSAGTFTFDGKSVKTATEVVSENSMTYRTRNSHLTNVEQFIQELIISTLELARETYDANGNPLYTGNVPKREDIVVDFDDGVFTDKNALLNFWIKASTAGLAPSVEAIQKIHNLTEDEAKKWYNEIQVEKRFADPDEEQKRAESTLLGAWKE